MTQKEKQLITLLAQVSRLNVLSTTTDPLQKEIHTLLMTELDSDYKYIREEDLLELINSK